MTSSSSTVCCRQTPSCWQRTFDLADVPPGREVYVFSIGLPNASDYPAAYTLGPEVYANPAARQTVFRRSWAAPEFGELHVVRLARP